MSGDPSRGRQDRRDILTGLRRLLAGQIARNLSFTLQVADTSMSARSDASWGLATSSKAKMEGRQPHRITDS
jgi:hypothetical protein